MYSHLYIEVVIQIAAGESWLGLHIDTSEHMDRLYKVSYHKHNERSNMIYVAHKPSGLP